MSIRPPLFAPDVSRYVCVLPVAKNIHHERMDAMDIVDRLCDDIMWSCDNIYHFVNRYPCPVTRLDYWEIIDQVFEIENIVLKARMLALDCLEQGELSQRVIFPVYGITAKMTDWIQSIVDARGLPKKLLRAA